MTSRPCVFAAFCLVLIGCTSSGGLRSDVSIDSLNDVNKALSGKLARIELQEGDVIRHARNVRISETITSWQTFHMQRTMQVPTENVVKVTVPESKVRHFAPLIGLSGGGAAAALWMLIENKDCEGPTCLVPTVMFPWVVAGGAAAGFIGGLIVRGSTDQLVVYVRSATSNPDPH